MRTFWRWLSMVEQRRIIFDRAQREPRVYFLGERKIPVYLFPAHFLITCPETGETREVFVRLMPGLRAESLIKPASFSIVLFCRWPIGSALVPGNVCFNNFGRDDDYPEFDEAKMKALIIKEYKAARVLAPDGRRYSKDEVVAILAHCRQIDRARQLEDKRQAKALRRNQLVECFRKRAELA